RISHGFSAWPTHSRTKVMAVASSSTSSWSERTAGSPAVEYPLAMILPSPPYELSRDYVKRRKLQIALFSSLGAAFFSLCLWISGREAVQIVAETRTWNAGEPALSATVEGRETTSKLIFRNYDLEVRFVGKDGSSHQGNVEFETVFGSVNSTIPPTVRYLASDPTRFALSWGQQALAHRWTAVAVFGVFGVALGGVFLALPRSALGELRLAR